MIRTSPLIQAYMTLLFMVVHGISGALFAISFLSLKRRRPTTYRWLLAYIALGAVGITTLIIMQNQLVADFFAFSYLSAMTVTFFSSLVLRFTTSFMITISWQKILVFRSKFQQCTLRNMHFAASGVV